MERIKGLALFCFLCILAVSANATEIPSACSSQAPWGPPVWQGKEPPLTPLCRHAYVTLHDNNKLVPDFVSWRLTAIHALGCLRRKDAFAPDPDLPPGHRAELVDYKGHKGEFDRGHFAPAADFEWTALVQRQSFYLSNMSPQASQLNQGEWEELEEATRAWSEDHRTLIIMDGPIWNGHPKTIGPDHVYVPSAYWKVIVDPKTHGTLAFFMKNAPIRKGDLSPYLVSISEIEKNARFSLPLPNGVNRTVRGPLWPANINKLEEAKRQRCHHHTRMH